MTGSGEAQQETLVIFYLPEANKTPFTNLKYMDGGKVLPLTKGKRRLKNE
jgi:hypothetical protein